MDFVRKFPQLELVDDRCFDKLHACSTENSCCTLSALVSLVGRGLNEIHYHRSLSMRLPDRTISLHAPLSSISVKRELRCAFIGPIVTSGIKTRFTREHMPEYSATVEISAPEQCTSAHANLRSMTFSSQEDVIDQVRNLRFNHELIHHEFEAIRRALQNIHGYAKGSKRDECRRMIEDWSHLHDTYLKLLWMSKSIAGDARATAIDFVDAFFPHVIADNEVDIQTRTDMLGDYIKHLENNKNHSKSLTDGFTQLQSDVECFHDRWKLKIKESGLIHMSSRHRSYEASIAELNTQLRPLRFKLYALKVTMVIVTSAKGVIAAIDEARENNGKTALSHALVEAKNEIRRLKDRAVFLKGAKAEDPYDPIISDIAAKLGAIASLWNGIASDLGLFRGLMIQAVNHQDGAARSLYNARISTICAHYRKLAEVFLEFQVSLEGSSVLKQV